MFKVSYKVFFKYNLLLLLLLVFVFGGFTQIFIGVPYTLYLILILLYLFLLIVTDIIIKQKIFFSNLIRILLLLLLVIMVSGIINKTELIKILLYSFFSFVPLLSIYVIHIAEREGIITQNWLSKIIKIIIYIQLPIIIIQKTWYNELIPFAKSRQYIAEVDFMFGSFFLKADHALGFFLIIYLLANIIKYQYGRTKSINWTIISYISLTIFIMESNVSKLVLIMIALFYLSKWLYYKFKILSVVGVFAVLNLGLIVANNIPAIKSEIFHIKNAYTIKESSKAVEKGHAKRPQVIIDMLANKPIKVIGNGPYDYYNILTGKFKNTIHFSQLIWSYNDLGIIGIMVIIIILLSIIKFLELDIITSILFSFILLMYFFMTNILYDIEILLSLILLKIKK